MVAGENPTQRKASVMAGPAGAIKWRSWPRRGPWALGVGMQIGAATVENSMEFPQKIKNRAAYDLAIPVLGIWLRRPKALI